MEQAQVTIIGAGPAGLTGSGAESAQCEGATLKSHLGH
jgi:thioredoxin reductase